MGWGGFCHLREKPQVQRAGPALPTTLGRAFEQILDGGGDSLFRIENCRACHQHVGPSLHHQPRRLVVDPAVHFDFAIEPAFLDRVADLADFAERFGNEILACRIPD